MHLGNMLHSLVRHVRKLARLLRRIRAEHIRPAAIPQIEHTVETPVELSPESSIGQSAWLDDTEQRQPDLDAEVSISPALSAETECNDRPRADAILLPTITFEPPPLSTRMVSDESAAQPSELPVAETESEVEDILPDSWPDEIKPEDEKIPYEDVHDLPPSPTGAEEAQLAETTKARAQVPKSSAEGGIPDIELLEIMQAQADEETPHTSLSADILPIPEETDRPSAKVAGAIEEGKQLVDLLPERTGTTALARPHRPLSVRFPISRRSKPTPKFDFSQHPQITPQELEEFLQKADLGQLDTIAGLTARKLDALLMSALEAVDLIGELPISEKSFAQIAMLMRSTFMINNRPHILRIWPALFVSSMVFCARYSKEDVYNFWTPYAKLVWHLPEATQYFQSLCRTHFEHCRKYLEREYGFRFPLVPGLEGSVVRPVFYHAMIPSHLQDDFARWLAANVDKLCDYDTGLLPYLRGDPGLSQMPPLLRRFIFEEDTAETAATLIAHLAEAAKLYQEGEDVTALMSNPIQRALWEEVQKTLEENVERQLIRRVPRPRLTWVWSLLEAELQLRLSNLFVDPARHAPDLCVWTEKAEKDLSKSKTAVPLNPFRSHHRGWLVDEIFLAEGPLDGQISVLSEEHEDESPDVLYQADVPHLPHEPILFFRVQQGEIGVLVEDSQRIVDGKWLISMAEGVELRGADGRKLAAIESRYVPDVLRDYCAHISAGLYELWLPVTVLQDEHEILRLERNRDEIGQPWLDGPNMLQGLSPYIPPAFTALPIKLHIPFVEEGRLRRITLAIKSDLTQSVVTLYELQARGSLVRTNEGECVITLDTLLSPLRTGLYSVNLRQNLKALSDEPIRFAFLPGVVIRPPDPKQHYSPKVLPQAYIEGVSESQVLVRRDQTTRESWGDGVLVTWRDLRAPECSLRLEIEGQSIPLAWPIKRTYAWVEGLAADGRLRARNRDQAIIFVRGEPNQRITLRIVNDDQQRSIQLNAQGQWDCKLSQDQLIEMIEHCPHTHVSINIRAAGSEWELFEYVRKPDFSLRYVTYEAEQERLMIKAEVGHVCEGNFQLQLLDPNATMEPPWTIGNFRRLESSLTFKLPSRLLPGDYRVQILSDGEPLDLNPAVSDFRVEVEPQVGLRDDFLTVLTWSGPDIQRQFLSDKVTVESNLVQRLAAINRPDEWIQQYGLLPAWAVVSSPLILTTREHRVQLRVYPEVASHKGRAGKGYVKLDLGDNAPTKAYATWEQREEAQNVLFSSQLKIMIPPHEVQGPFSELDELDLWPAYQCSLCGKIVGSRSGTYFKLSPSLLNEHMHYRKYQDKRERFRDIVYAYDLHVSVEALAGKSLSYVFPPHKVFDTHYLLSKLQKTSTERPAQEVSSPISVEAYRRAVDEWLYNYHTGYRSSIERLAEQWHESFDRLEEKRHSISSEPMLAAANRLLDAVTAERSSGDQIIWLDRNMIMLALILRSFTLTRQTRERLLHSANLTQSDLRQMLELALRVCPLLLEWAITWVELFRVHAIS